MLYNMRIPKTFGELDYAVATVGDAVKNLVLLLTRKVLWALLNGSLFKYYPIFYTRSAKNESSPVCNTSCLAAIIYALINW